MNQHAIVLLPGDGVGSELIGAARRVLDAGAMADGGFALRYTECPFGHGAYRDCGRALPEQTLTAIRQGGALLMGALDVRDIPSPSPVGFLRRELSLYADVRAARAVAGVWALRPDIDIVCIREATEGFLADRNLYRGYAEFSPTPGEVLSLRVVTQTACERIARFAFAYAAENGRRSITALHKGNVLKMGDGLFLDCFRRVAAEYPRIEAREEYVDTACGNLIAHPENYDVLLTTNLYGDLISDELAATVSGLVPVGTYGPKHALFMSMNHEPREELAGKDAVDPRSMLLTCALLLEYLREPAAARRLRDAVRAVCAERTPGARGCAAFVDEVCKVLGS